MYMNIIKRRAGGEKCSSSEPNTDMLDVTIVRDSEHSTLCFVNKNTMPPPVTILGRGGQEEEEKDFAVITPIIRLSKFLDSGSGVGALKFA